MATITSLGFSIFSTYNGAGVSAARRDLNDLNGDLDRANTKLAANAKSFFSVSSAALALGPGLLTVAQGLVGVGGAAGAMAVAAGAGFLVFGKMVKEQIGNIQNMQAAHMKLTGTEQQFLKAQDQLTAAMGNFSAVTRSATVAPLIPLYQGLVVAVKELTPTFLAAAQGASTFTSKLGAFLKGSDFANFAKVLTATIKPIMSNLGSAAASFVKVLIDGIKVFLPEGVKLSAVIKRGADELQRWSDNGGFANFLTKVHNNAPAVTGFFKALGGALHNVGSAIAGLGPISLGITTLLLRLVAALPPWVIQGIVVAILAWRAAMFIMAAANLLATISTIALGSATVVTTGMIVAMSATILLLLAVVVGLGIGIYMLVTHWNTVWNAIKSTAETIWNFLKSKWGWLLTFFAPPISILLALGAHWQQVWGIIKLVGEAIWNGLKIAWNATVQGFITAWQVVSAAFVAAWNAVWNGISVAVRAIWAALQIAWSAFINAMAIVWQTVSAALVASWNAVWNALSIAAKAIWAALQLAWSLFITTLNTIWQTVSGALSASWNAIWNAMKAAAQAIWNALQAAWNAFWAAMRSIFNSVMSAIQSSWSAAWNAVKSAGQAIWNAIQAAWSAFWNALRSVFNSMMNAIRSSWSAAWNAVKSAGQAIWNAIKSAFDSFMNGVKKVATDGMNAAKKIFSDAWNAIKSTAKSMWHDIGKVIEGGVNAAIDVLNGIIKGWDAVVKAVGLSSLNVNPVGHVSFNFAEGGMVPDQAFHKGGMSSLARSNGRSNKAMRKDLTHGGHVFGYSPGKDTVPAILSPGEGVLVPEAVKALGGPRFIYQANHHFSGGRAKSPYFPGYANGGMVGGLMAMLQGGGVVSPGGGNPSQPGGGGTSPTVPGGGDPNKPNPPSKPGQTGPGSTTVPAPGQTPTTGSTLGDLASILGKGAEQILEQIIKGALGLAGGVTGVVGSVVGGAGSAIKGIVGGSVGSLLLGFIGNAAIEKSFDIFNTYSDGKLKGKFGNIGDMADAGMHKIVDGLIKKMEDEDAKAQKAFAAMAVAGAQSVQAWAPTVSAALALDGDPQSWVAPLLVTMQKESGGNPNAVNNYDINAQNGTPSMGLMQVIGPTFSAYCMPGFCANILDPLSNILAAIRYIKAVYGVPTGKSPYATGTTNATQGWHRMGEHGPEMWFNGGEKVWDAARTRKHMNSQFADGGGPIVVNVENHWHGNPTKEAVQYAETGMAERLRQACEVGTGRRPH